MPILGVIASQLALANPAWDSLQTGIVGSGGASSISFTAIPSTYKHLQIRGILKNTNPDAAGSPMTLTVNSDTTYTNYYNHQLQGTGSGTPAAYSVQAAAWQGAGVGNVADANYTSVFSAFVIDILDYADTSKFKTIRTLNGFDANGAGVMNLWSGLWKSTSAITSLTTQFPQGRTLAQYSHFALYGIKG